MVGLMGGGAACLHAPGIVRIGIIGIRDRLLIHSQIGFNLGSVFVIWNYDEHYVPREYQLDLSEVGSFVNGCSSTVVILSNDILL